MRQSGIRRAASALAAGGLRRLRSLRAPGRELLLAGLPLGRFELRLDLLELARGASVAGPRGQREPLVGFGQVLGDAAAVGVSMARLNWLSVSPRSAACWNQCAAAA